MWARIKDSRKAIIAALAAAASAAGAALPGGVSRLELWGIVLAGLSMGLTTWAVPNGDRPTPVMERQGAMALRAAAAPIQRPRWGRRAWVLAFLGVTGLALGMEVTAAADKSDDTLTWTQLIVEHVHWEVFAAVWGALAIWGTVHFGVRYIRKERRAE